MPRDAEAWLAERGVRREPLVTPSRDVDVDDADGAAARPAASQTGAPGVLSAGEPPATSGGDAPDGTSDQEQVTKALAFIRRSTAATPQPEARLRAKLADRDVPDGAIDAAMQAARAEGLVDDAAMAAALVDERRERGHAPARIRRDLRARGFDDALLEGLLAPVEAQDQEAAAFAVAASRAARLTGEPADTAFRRVAGYVARRGYPDGLARKVAREAVFVTRETERTAGH